MSQPALDITVSAEGGWRVATVAGEVDLATAPDVEALGDAGGGLAVDLAGVRFIDSSGLRALLSLREKADPLVLIAPSATVRKLLALTSMVDMFDIRESTAELGAGA